MKKLFLTITLLAFCYTASAQDSKFGITAGYQSSSFEFSGDGLDLSTDASGFYLGSSHNFQFQKVLVSNQNFITLLFLIVTAMMMMNQ